MRFFIMLFLVSCASVKEAPKMNETVLTIPGGHARTVAAFWQVGQKKCSECMSKRWKSEVRMGATMINAVHCDPGYWNENGIWIANDCEQHSETTYYCSKGHEWTE